MMLHPSLMNDIKKSLTRSLFFSLVAVLLLVSGVLPAKAQYPYIIEMSHKMIGNATIVAKQEIIHKPGL